MKYSYLALAAAVSSFGILGCSDDKPNNPSNPTGDVYSSSSIYSEIPGAGLSSSTIVDVPDPDPVDKPVTEDEKKDDGTASVGTLPFSIKGVAEFGPFGANSPVKIYSVDLSTMTETPVANASVADNLGSYSATGTLNSAIAVVEVSGTYYDFISGVPGISTSLKAIVDLRERKTVNVNVLTHLEYSRVKTHLAAGLNFTAAKERAQQEILAALGFKADSTNFEDISLYQISDAAENLLATTAALLALKGSDIAELYLNAAALDISGDGRLDDDQSKATIGDAVFDVDGDEVGGNLSQYNSYADYQTFKTGMKKVWAAMYNLGSCSDLNRNEVKQNANAFSTNASKMFACREGGWAEASAVFVKSAEVAKANGACTEANSGKIVNHTDGKQYVCRNNMWKVASAEDVAASAIATPCNSSNQYAVAASGSLYFVCLSSGWTKTVNAPVDYSKGRAMNKKLGRGVNFGNSWDAPGTGDGGWSNPIGDGDFATAKAAGFNSVRLPVRWSAGVDAQLNGVKEDVQLAIKAGLTVIVNSHHHDNVYSAAKNGNFDGALQNFANEWKKVAQAFDSFSDDAVVFEIFNEPHDMTADQVKKLMTTGYNAIRSVTKTKTIMFEGNGYAKFAQIPNLDLPADGNIIVTGHYYDPYTFTHQGHGDAYNCNANANDGISAMAGHFKSYADSIAVYFPDINGGSVPMNMGEFGVANKGTCRSISDAKREAWVDAVITQAEKYGMSWQYWCFKNCGGFEAWNGSWYGNILNVFMKNR